MIAEFLLFFGIQFLHYGLRAWDYRVCAQARYGGIALVNILCGVVSFLLIQRVASSDSLAALAGYVAGGAVGAVLATWAAKWFYDPGSKRPAREQPAPRRFRLRGRQVEP